MKKNINIDLVFQSILFSFILIKIWFDLIYILQANTFNDLQANQYLFESDAHDLSAKMPTIFLLKFVINDYKTLHILLSCVIIIAAKKLIDSMLKSKAMNNAILLIYFLVPYGAVTMYSNVFYNGVAISLVVIGLLAKSKVTTSLMIILALGIHLKGVLFFFGITLFPAYIAIRFGYRWFIFFILVSSVITVGMSGIIFNYADTIMGEDYYQSNMDYTHEGRNDSLLRIKLVAFMLFVITFTSIFGGKYFKKLYINLLTYSGIFSFVLILNPAVPVIERFIHPILQLAILTLIALILLLLPIPMKKHDKPILWIKNNE